jgi:hypothetical protein
MKKQSKVKKEQKLKAAKMLLTAKVAATIKSPLPIFSQRDHQGAGLRKKSGVLLWSHLFGLKHRLSHPFPWPPA